MTSPDMVWYTCLDCGRDFTLADIDGNECPHCGYSEYVYYNEVDE